MKLIKEFFDKGYFYLIASFIFIYFMFKVDTDKSCIINGVMAILNYIEYKFSKNN